MPRHRDHTDQGLLFGDDPASRALAVVPPAAHPQDWQGMAARLPSTVRLGTSSWSFPGWRGLLYARDAAASDLARFGLAAYSQCPLLRTVGLDRAFYSLCSAREASELAGLVPSNFRFLVKAHQSFTRPFVSSAGSTFGDTAALARDGAPNPTFLDATHAIESMIVPLLDGFGSGSGTRLGPIVFQFPPIWLDRRGPWTTRRLIDRLEAFLSQLPHGPIYVVEVRNRELIVGPDAPALIAAIKAHQVCWGFAHHPTLPSLQEQAERCDRHGWPLEAQPALSIRWLLGHGLGYEEAKERFAPFTDLAAPDVPTRLDILALLNRAVERSIPTWVIANNKAEGSAPWTLVKLAEALVANLPQPDPGRRAET